jgi:cell division GTPase FtsZ
MSFETLRFHNRKNMDVSVKFSFAGIGLMGCRVADTISLLSKDGKQIYPTLGININKGDLDQQKNLLNKLQLKCSFDAAGRDPALGSKAISQYEETIKTALKEIAKGTKFLWLIVGLGGGTGTGAIMKVASWTKQMQTIGIDFGIIFSIPREKDGFVENQNALKVLSILNEVASNRQIPLIPIDNELLFEKHLNDLQGKEYTSQANEDIAGLLHQINIITKYTPYGSRHFDGQEFYTVLKNGGCIQFSKTILNLSDFRENVSLKTKIQNSLVNGIASEGYNIQNANMAGISIFVPSIEYA